MSRKLIEEIRNDKGKRIGEIRQNARGKSEARNQELTVFGPLRNKHGEGYGVVFDPRKGHAEAVGPHSNRVGNAGKAFEVKAESEEEARQKLDEVINNPDDFKKHTNG